MCEPVQSECTSTFHESHSARNSTRTMPGSRPAFLASLHTRNASGHVTRATLCGISTEKMGTGFPEPSFCASLRSRNAHGHFTRAILCGNVREKCQTLKIPPRLNTGPQKPTVRTRQCGHTVSRTNPMSQPLMAPLVCYFALVWCNFGQKLHKPQENQEN